MLHHLRTLILIRCQRPFICPKMPVNKGFPAIRLFQVEVLVAGSFFSSPVATRVFLHDSPKFRVKIHDCVVNHFSIADLHSYSTKPKMIFACRWKISDSVKSVAVSASIRKQIYFLPCCDCLSLAGKSPVQMLDG